MFTSSHPLPVVNVDDSSNQVAFAVAILPQAVHSSVGFRLKNQVNSVERTRRHFRNRKTPRRTSNIGSPVNRDSAANSSSMVPAHAVHVSFS